MRSAILSATVTAGIGQDDHELLAADPAHQIDIANALPETLGELLEHAIADVVAVRDR